MNELLDDVSSNDRVITRLRSALDEVTADPHGLVAVESPRERVSAGRWIAAAAAIVLVAGAVTAIAINRRNAPEVASVPTEVATTIPKTEPTLIRKETPWFRLTADDLVPGERVHEQESLSKLLVMAWSRPEPLAYFSLTAYNKSQLPTFVPGATLRQGVEDGMLDFRSYGLTDDEREALADQVVPGSGLPYLLPVDGWQFTAMGYSSSEDRLEQVYTPLNQDPLSSYLPTVRMSVGEYAGQLSFLSWPDPKSITVAGHEGWKVTGGGGWVVVFWDAGDGNWATLTIDPQLADRADELVAGVVQVTEDSANSPTVETILAPGVDVVPTALAVGNQLTGNLVPVASQGPTLFVFVSSDCDPCTNAIRTLLAAGAADPTHVPQIAVVIEGPLSTEGNWLTETGWTGRVVLDTDGSSSALFGTDAVPGYVFITINSDGTILDLDVGLFTGETLAGLGIG